MLTAAIAAPKINFDTVAMISFSAVARPGGLQPISPSYRASAEIVTGYQRRASRYNTLPPSNQTKPAKATMNRALSNAPLPLAVK
jgi:hypothetical protein